MVKIITIEEFFQPNLNSLFTILQFPLHEFSFTIYEKFLI